MTNHNKFQLSICFKLFLDNFKKLLLVPLKFNFVLFFKIDLWKIPFLWNGTVISGFDLNRLKQWPNHQTKYAFVNFFAGIVKINTRVFHLPKFCKIKYGQTVRIRFLLNVLFLRYKAVLMSMEHPAPKASALWLLLKWFCSMQVAVTSMQL